MSKSEDQCGAFGFLVCGGLGLLLAVAYIRSSYNIGDVDVGTFSFLYGICWTVLRAVGGAAIGAVIGAVVGAAIGRGIENRWRKE